MSGPYYRDLDDPYEATKVIEAWGLSFHRGNAVKYAMRAGTKPGNPEHLCLLKGAWSLLREAQRAGFDIDDVARMADELAVIIRAESGR